MNDTTQTAIANILNLSMRVDQPLAALVSSGEAKLEATKVLVLYNLVSLRDLVEDQCYKELCEEIEEEGSKFGNIVSLTIPKPNYHEKYAFARIDGEQDQYSDIYPLDEQNKGFGKILIEFEAVEQAERAQQELAGRKYQGRICVTSYLDVDNYYNKKYL